MQKYMRWSAILVVLMLALAACQSDGGDASEEPEASADESAPVESTDDGGELGVVPCWVPMPSTA